MSWLKSTFNKVIEQGEALKTNPTLRTWQEKTSSAVMSATHQVRKATDAVRSSRTIAAEEFGQHLEQQARTAHGSGITDLHRGWLQQFSTKDVYRGLEGERNLSFKEVLLRSRAMEISLEVIAKDPVYRQEYATPPAEDDVSSPAACLYLLLGKMLVCPPSVWSDIVQLALTSENVAACLDWILVLISSMKHDWYEDVLQLERKRLVQSSDRLRLEIRQLEAMEGESDMNSFQCPHRRVIVSSELLQLYFLVRQNLTTAQAHRGETLGTRQSDLALLLENLQTHTAHLSNSAKASNKNLQLLDVELKQSQESGEAQLQRMAEARGVIDQEVEQLEERKRQLKTELEQVSRKLNDARARQRESMETCDRQRSELDAAKTGIKEQLKCEDLTLKEMEGATSLTNKTEELVKKVDVVLRRTLQSQLEELTRKQSLFKDKFQELIKEHVRYVEIELGSFGKQVEACVSACCEKPAAKEVLEAITMAEESLVKFHELQSWYLENTPLESAVQRLRSEHAALRELLVSAAEVQEARPHVGVVNPSCSTTSSEGSSTPTDPKSAAAIAQDSELTSPTSSQDSTVVPATEDSLLEASNMQFDVGGNAEGSTAAVPRVEHAELGNVTPPLSSQVVPPPPPGPIV